MKSKLFLLLVVLIFSQTLMACKRILVEEYEELYVNEALKVLDDAGISGEAEMVFNYKTKHIRNPVYNYTLRVDSDDFELLTEPEQELVLTKLKSIDFKDVLFDVPVIIYSGGIGYEDSFDIHFPGVTHDLSNYSSSSNSTCDTLFDNYDDARVISGGKITDLTTYYMNALMQNNCFDVDD